MATVMTLREVASYLRVSRSTIYRLLKKGRLPAFRLGTDWRFNAESIDRWRVHEESAGAGAEFGESISSH
jgi:excisionase family DNA binding protein